MTARLRLAPMAWVPLIRARPSLAPSSIGCRLRRARARLPGTISPSTSASPSPIITSTACARGARSPLAPSEPWAGTTGCTR